MKRDCIQTGEGLQYQHGNHYKRLSFDQGGSVLQMCLTALVTHEITPTFLLEFVQSFCIICVLTAHGEIFQRPDSPLVSVTTDRQNLRLDFNFNLCVTHAGFYPHPSVEELVVMSLLEDRISKRDFNYSLIFVTILFFLFLWVRCYKSILPVVTQYH